MRPSEVVCLRFDGSIYTGHVIKHGYGTQVDKFGNKYEGQWHLNQMGGQGRITFIDGSRYEGGWSNGKFHGQGSLTFGDLHLFDSRMQEALSTTQSQKTGDG